MGGGRSCLSNNNSGKSDNFAQRVRFGVENVLLNLVQNLSYIKYVFVLLLGNYWKEKNMGDLWWWGRCEKRRRERVRRFGLKQRRSAVAQSPTSGAPAVMGDGGDGC